MRIRVLVSMMAGVLLATLILASAAYVDLNLATSVKPLESEASLPVPATGQADEARGVAAPKSFELASETMIEGVLNLYSPDVTVLSPLIIPLALALVVSSVSLLAAKKLRNGM